MSLGILLILVVGGISGIAVLTWVLGLGQQALIADETALRGIWDADNPLDPAASVHLAASRRCGLVRSASGGLGVVWPMGADHATRLLSPASALHLGRRGYYLVTGDYTAPRIALTLTDDEADQWVAMLEDQTEWARN